MLTWWSKNRPSLPAPTGESLDRPLHLATLSAQTAEALTELASRHADLEQHPQLPLADICHTLNTGRSHLSERLAFVVDSTEKLAEQLGSFAKKAKYASSPARQPPAARSRGSRFCSPAKALNTPAWPVAL